MTDIPEAQTAAVGDRTLLIVDDDKPFLERLAKAMTARGFEVETADGVAAGIAAVRRVPPSPCSTCGSATATGSISCR